MLLLLQVRAKFLWKRRWWRYIYLKLFSPSSRFLASSKKNENILYTTSYWCSAAAVQTIKLSFFSRLRPRIWARIDRDIGAKPWNPWEQHIVCLAKTPGSAISASSSAKGSAREKTLKYVYESLSVSLFFLSYKKKIKSVQGPRIFSPCWWAIFIITRAI